jgi:hypothetical protein
LLACNQRIVLGGLVGRLYLICISDMAYAEDRLGDRVVNAYTWRSFLNESVALAFGSDFPGIHFTFKITSSNTSIQINDFKIELYVLIYEYV